ncbi:MAG: hypothetical protein WD696_15985 [Bryobacteraceae bacterium]
MFACTFGGALCGIKLGAILPPHHLSAQSRDTVKVGIGLIATMTALVLGLVTASAKSSFDARDTAVKHAAADIISLDRNLAQYGPETAAIRAALKRAVAHRIEMTWPEGRSRPIQLDPSYAARGVERIAAQIRDLSPQTNNQRQLKSRALALSESLLEARWLVFGDFGTSIPVPFLTVLLFWLTMTFVSFGLLAPRNATVVSVLFVCAVSVACAVFLVLEMDGAFEGLITVSPNALKYALAHLNQ